MLARLRIKGVAASLEKQAKRQGVDIKVDKVGSCGIVGEFYIAAFFDLCTCRPMSFGGAMPLRWIDVEQYAIMNEYDADQRYILHELIASLDPAYLKWAHDESNKGRKNTR